MPITVSFFSPHTPFLLLFWLFACRFPCYSLQVLTPPSVESRTIILWELESLKGCWFDSAFLLASTPAESVTSYSSASHMQETCIGEAALVDPDQCSYILLNCCQAGTLVCELTSKYLDNVIIFCCVEKIGRLGSTSRLAWCGVAYGVFSSELSQLAP